MRLSKRHIRIWQRFANALPLASALAKKAESLDD